MIAQKGPDTLFVGNIRMVKKVPALFAVEQDSSGSARSLAIAYAKGIGGTRAGILETNFEKQKLIYLANKLFVRRLSELVKSASKLLGLDIN